ncbi:FecR family protein [Novosphingobium sp.]|uniref:FecR family protein n=1 Tax=Novosphingobium sp. TaxID=1874826 RepID=UPI003B52A4FB
MARRATSSEVDEAAAQWAARLDRGQIGQSDQQALDRWLEDDIRHVGALGRAQAILVRLDMAAALGGDFGAEVHRSPLISRRSLLGASAAAAAIAASAAWIIGRPHFSTYTTGKGEVRLIPLTDGSSVTLNTASHIEVHLGTRRREVRLIDGEALFEVARDRTRPFTVEAGPASVEAVGTAFTVRNTRDRLIVDVQEGAVEMNSTEASFEPRNLTANMRAEAHLRDGILHVSQIDAAEQQDDLAWRDGKIAFRGETLREAADELARYGDTRIVFADSGAAARTITGYFSATDTIGFARAASESLNLDMRVEAGKVIFTSKGANWHPT